MIKIAPSILSADFANLERDIQRISTADYLSITVRRIDARRSQCFRDFINCFESCSPQGILPITVVFIHQL